MRGESFPLIETFPSAVALFTALFATIWTLLIHFQSIASGEKFKSLAVGI